MLGSTCVAIVGDSGYLRFALAQQNLQFTHLVCFATSEACVLLSVIRRLRSTGRDQLIRQLDLWVGLLLHIADIAMHRVHFNGSPMGPWVCWVPRFAEPSIWRSTSFWMLNPCRSQRLLLRQYSACDPLWIAFSGGIWHGPTVRLRQDKTPQWKSGCHLLMWRQGNFDRMSLHVFFFGNRYDVLCAPSLSNTE
jgi:hypothetical protein